MVNNWLNSFFIIYMDKLIKEVRALEREVMHDRSNDCKLGIPPVIPYVAKLNQLGILCLDMAEKYNGKQADF